MANENIPQIRFKGFDGEWRLLVLGAYSEIYRGGSPRPIDAYLTTSSNGINWIKIGDVNKESKYITTTQERIIEEGVINSRKVYSGDLILSNSMSFGRPYILGINGCIHDGWLVIQNYHNIFDKEYLYYSLAIPSVLNQYKKMAAGSSVKNLNKDIVSEVVLPVPSSKCEQTRIASLFTAIDKQISCSEAKLDKLRAIKMTLLKKMFASQGEKTPQIRFKGFEEEWEEKLLGEIGTINSGCDYKHLNRGNIPVYGTGGYMTSVDKALSYTKDAIGIGRKGTIDNPYILKAPFWTVDTLFYVFPKDNINLNFLFNLYCKVDWRSKNEASGVPSLSKGIINNVCIKTASLSEQTRIASLFTALDKQISCQEKKIGKLKAVKKTLLKKMFV